MIDPRCAALVARSLGEYRYRYTAERELQDTIGGVLAGHGWPYAREVRLGPIDRIDFVVLECLGLEVKAARRASYPDALRQLTRYAHHETIRALILVTDRRQLMGMPNSVNEKPLYVVPLMSGLS